MCGVLATVLLIGLGFALPAHSGGIPLAFVPTFIMVALAQWLQGKAFESHKLAGGQVASKWSAAGVGVVSFVVLVGSIFAIVFAMEPTRGTRLPIGSSEIYYSGSSTEAEAKALGKALTDDGYFAAGRTTTVLISKDANGTTLRFVVKPEEGQKDSTLDAFGKVAEDVAPAVGGKPITLKLVDPDLKELRSKILPANPPTSATTSDLPVPKIRQAPIDHPVTPAVPVNDASKFTGTFSSDKLTATFAATGPGQFTGTIKLGDQQFPAVGQVQGGQLVGTFEAGGSKFDFTASVDGNAMRLLSAQKKYDLTKIANPLTQSQNH